MNTRKRSIFTRLAAAALVAILLVGSYSVTNADAALAKPQNCHFSKWIGTNFKSFLVRWNQVKGADGYQSVWSWTNGSHAYYYYHGSDASGVYTYNAPNNHVTMIRVRAYRWTKSGKRSYSAWSNIAYITPSPTSVSGSIVSRTATHPQARLKWNTIYGSDGYNLFLTTNPYSTWRWNQSTSRKATATTCVVKKYSGSNLKYYTNYYYKLVTRRRYNGVFCTVPMPSNSFYTGYFWFSRTYY